MGSQDELSPSATGSSSLPDSVSSFVSWNHAEEKQVRMAVFKEMQLKENLKGSNLKVVTAAHRP